MTGVYLGQIGQHAERLRALSGKHEGEMPGFAVRESLDSDIMRSSSGGSRNAENLCSISGHARLSNPRVAGCLNSSTAPTPR